VDWSEERYVRVYTRDTADLLAFGWQGRAVWWELLRKADRAGVIDTDCDAAVLAELLRMPLDVVEAGIERIEARRCITRTQRAITIQNFTAAQEAPKSDRLRAAESRERRRAEAMHGSHGASPGVTDCHADVTNRDDSSRSVRNVTPYRTVPDRAVPRTLEVADSESAPPVAIEPGEPKPPRAPSLIPERAWKAADYLRRRILEHQPTNALAKKPWQGNGSPSRLRRAWADTIRLTVETDGRTYEQLAAAIDWVFGANQSRDFPFVVLSPKALREKFDPIDHAMHRRAGKRDDYVELKPL